MKHNAVAVLELTPHAILANSGRFGSHPTCGATVAPPTTTMRQVRPHVTLDDICATTRNLTVPHGFTLTISGVFAMDVADSGFPGALSVWLFVLGGTVAFVLLAFASGAHTGRAKTIEASSGAAVFNAVAVAVVPACYAATAWISAMWAEYLLAGFLAVGLYVAAHATLTRFVARPSTAL